VSATPPVGVDLALLDMRLTQLRRLMNTHAGTVALRSVSNEGVVTLQFGGMCQGCAFRPVTLFGLLSPAIQSIPGVTGVRVEGVRVSDEAAARALAALRENGSPLPDLGWEASSGASVGYL
jgi:Fe-S cluster biogenesis protein NfuA